MTVFFSYTLSEEYNVAAKSRGSAILDFSAINNKAPEITVSCRCGVEFNIPRTRAIQSVRYLQKNGRPLGIYCSNECRAEQEESLVIKVPCTGCGALLSNPRNKDGNNFCSQKCCKEFQFRGRRKPILEKPPRTPPISPQLQIRGMDLDSIREGKPSTIFTCQYCNTTREVLRDYAISAAHRLPSQWFCSNNCKLSNKYKELCEKHSSYISFLDVVDSSTTGKDCPYKCAKCGGTFYVTPRQIQKKIHSTSSPLCVKCSTIPKTSKKRDRRDKDKHKRIKAQSAGCPCGITIPWLLVVHHKDGNTKNNHDSNLEVLCHNCHVTRHLELIDGEWRFNSHCLTPRDKLPSW